MSDVPVMSIEEERAALERILARRDVQEGQPPPRGELIYRATLVAGIAFTLCRPGGKSIVFDRSKPVPIDEREFRRLRDEAVERNFRLSDGSVIRRRKRRFTFHDLKGNQLDLEPLENIVIREARAPALDEPEPRARRVG